MSTVVFISYRQSTPTWQMSDYHLRALKGLKKLGLELLVSKVCRHVSSRCLPFTSYLATNFGYPNQVIFSSTFLFYGSIFIVLEITFGNMHRRCRNVRYSKERWQKCLIYTFLCSVLVATSLQTNLLFIPDELLPSVVFHFICNLIYLGSFICFIM